MKRRNFLLLLLSGLAAAFGYLLGFTTRPGGNQQASPSATRTPSKSAASYWYANPIVH